MKTRFWYPGNMLKKVKIQSDPAHPEIVTTVINPFNAMFLKMTYNE